MANYSLVIDSTFKPFTYQELAAPLDRQEAYQERIEEAYEQLSSQADVLEAMGANDRDKNSKTYGRYKAYSDSLRNEADNLYRFGLNSESRQRLTDLRRRYNQEIIPIQNAWQKREEEAKMQLTASMQNPSIMFTRDAKNTTLDEYINNPTGGFGVISGAQITAQMSQMAKNLEKQILSGKAENLDIDPLTYKYIQKYGLTEDMIRDWRNNPTLSRMFEQVMRANGVTPEALQNSPNADAIIAKSTNFAEMGMWDAIGQQTVQLHTNESAKMAAEEARQIRAEQRAAAREDAKARQQALGDLPDIVSMGVGLEGKGFTDKQMQALQSLKAGNDSMKRSIFGYKLGSVNPLQIYNEYQQAFKKYTNATSGSRSYPSPMGGGLSLGSSTQKPGTSIQDVAKKAREEVLKKYAKYGVTDILNQSQYDALKNLGYSEKRNIPSTHHYSSLMNDLNNTVKQRSRFSTNMSGYEHFNDRVIPELARRAGASQDAGTIWEYKGNGSYGKQLRAKDLNLYSNDNTKGAKVADVQYDPQYKGKIVLLMTDGNMYTAQPEIFSENLGNMIRSAETAGAPAEAITMAITQHLNAYNQTKSKSSSNAD